MVEGADASPSTSLLRSATSSRFSRTSWRTYSLDEENERAWTSLSTKSRRSSLSEMFIVAMDQPYKLCQSLSSDGSPVVLHRRTSASAGTDLNNKPTTTRRLQTAWQPVLTARGHLRSVPYRRLGPPEVVSGCSLSRFPTCGGPRARWGTNHAKGEARQQPMTSERRRSPGGATTGAGWGAGPMGLRAQSAGASAQTPRHHTGNRIATTIKARFPSRAHK